MLMLLLLLLLLLLHLHLCLCLLLSPLQHASSSVVVVVGGGSSRMRESVLVAQTYLPYLCCRRHSLSLHPLPFLVAFALFHVMQCAMPPTARCSTSWTVRARTLRSIPAVDRSLPACSCVSLSLFPRLSVCPAVAATQAYRHRTQSRRRPLMPLPA